MDRALLSARLRKHEGDVPYAYPDQFGYQTIGVGHLIDHRKGGGLSDRIRALILEEDMDKFERQMDGQFPWLKDHPDQVRSAIVEMIFQLGLSGVMAFKNALAALQAKDYPAAQAAFLDSAWAKQTPERAQEVVALITTPN